MTSDLKLNYQGVWDGHVRFGDKPVLVAVDVVNAYTEPESPLFADGATRALPYATRVVAACREARIPIVYTRVVYRDKNCYTGGIWLEKAPFIKSFYGDNKYNAICEEVAPEPDDIVLEKHYASAFFGTTLDTVLRVLGADTIVVIGFSTSGCIRATAVDGMQHGYRVFVVREAVGDRHDDPHEANLFDINAKYGEVIGLEELRQKLEGRGES